MYVDANIIVTDESIGNLDQTSSNEIVALLQKIAHEQNKTVIIVTHDLDVANQCDYIYELDNRQFNKLK